METHVGVGVRDGQGEQHVDVELVRLHDLQLVLGAAT
jgi:hypothetical protein